MNQENFTSYYGFRDSLTPDEELAIRKWLGMWGDAVRSFELYGMVPSNMSFEEMQGLVHSFENALSKAVVCTQIVYRGMSAGHWRPERIRFLRELVDGSEFITFASHDSATVSEVIGRSFCRTANEDEERDLSVLLRISPRTARFLAPFSHRACDEFEVVLLKGARYHRTAVRRLDAERPGQEFWGVDIREL